MEAVLVNKRDALNEIRRFSNKLDNFRKQRSSGETGRPVQKRNKGSNTKGKSRQGGINEQVRYAWQGALADLKSKPLATFLTVMVIAISLTLPSVCYMVYKNVSEAATQYYPSPQITVYLDKTLDDNAAQQVVGQLQAEPGVAKVNYLSRAEALGEFRNWSGLGGALLGFTGALLSLILSEILVMRLSAAVTDVAKVFGTTFEISGLSFDECLLLLLVCSMIGWAAAWLATVQHLRHFTPE